jgi:eukaryotic-like serine/threonine-protein kinase
MQTLHDNNWHAASGHFDRAAQLDPMMATAHLRFAMTSASRARDKSRSSYMRAADLCGQLTPRDQAMMEALEPVVLRSQGDPVEASRRLQLLIRRYPLDVELYDLLGVVRPDAPETLAASERAIELDAADGQAWQTKGTALWSVGRADEARAAFVRCSDLSVASADCLWSLAATDKVSGRCEDFESHARAYRDRNPGDGWSILTASMVAMNRPESAVRETFEQGVARLGQAERARLELVFNAELALALGDFAAVRALGSEEANAITADAAMRADFAPHYLLAIRTVSAALESGDAKEAMAVAHEFVSKSPTWARDPVPSRTGDLSLYLARLETPDSAVVQLAAKRKSWIDARVSEGHPLGTLWVPAFAAPAMTAEEAEVALVEMPKYAPIGHGFDNESIEDAIIGHVYVLAGKPQEAVPYLRRAVANCDVFLAPVAHTRATADLGDALAATGDKAGACSAYEAVVARWGKAKPRSITADTARDRARALGCSR